MDKLYSTAEAAAYLGLSVIGLKHHLYTLKDLAPDHKIGHALVFTQATLDRFRQIKQIPGRRPAAKPASD